MVGPNVVDDCEGMAEEDYWREMDAAMAASRLHVGLKRDPERRKVEHGF